MNHDIKSQSAGQGALGGARTLKSITSINLDYSKNPANYQTVVKRIYGRYHNGTIAIAHGDPQTAALGSVAVYQAISEIRQYDGSIASTWQNRLEAQL